MRDRNLFRKLPCSLEELTGFQQRDKICLTLEEAVLNSVVAPARKTNSAQTEGSWSAHAMPTMT